MIPLEAGQNITIYKIKNGINESLSSTAQEKPNIPFSSNLINYILLSYLQKNLNQHPEKNKTFCFVCTEILSFNHFLKSHCSQAINKKELITSV